MGIKISEMTPDASIGGGELLAVSDAGSAKSVTITGIKNFVVDQIEAITAGTAVTGADGVFILQSGVLKPVDIDLVAQHAIDTIWGKADDASPAGTDKMAIKDAGTTENTVTLANLATYIQGAIRAATLNPATLDAAGATNTADVFIIGQSGVAKKITLATLNTAILAGINAYVTALTAVTVSADSDVLYVIQGGVEKKVTLAEIKTLFGVSSAVQGPAITTENYVPQWDATTKLLKGGVAIGTSVAAAGGTGTGLVNETGIRTALDAVATAAFDWEDLSGADAKTTPVNADSIIVVDSEAASVQKTVTLDNLWANLLEPKIGLKKYVGVTSETALTAYTLVLTDAGKYLRFSNANPITLTIPPFADVAFPVGSFIEVEQSGVGLLTVAAGAGVTANADVGLKVAGQYGTVRLINVAEDEWTVTGGVA